MAYELFETCVLVPGFSRSECASWVQAWGSIFAILAAVGIALHQAKHQAKLLQQSKIDADALRIGEKFAPAIAIIQAAIDEMNDQYQAGLSERVNSAFGVSKDFSERHKWFAKAFSGIEAHTMPSVESAKVVLRVQDLFRQADTIMADAAFKLNNMGTITSADLATFHDLLSDLRNESDVLKTEAVRMTLPHKPVSVEHEGEA